MACREHGKGRMAEPESIVARVIELIGQPQDLSGVRVLVTAGRTEEAIDPVRVLTNRSSGRMGIALAEEALARGAEVTLLAGSMDIAPPEGVRIERIRSAVEMAQAAERLFPECDVLLMAAAIADYRPAAPRSDKLKRHEPRITLDLEATPDVLAGLAAGRDPRQILVGFALETDSSESPVREKMKRKGVDLLVLNNPNDEGAAIGGDTNLVTFFETGRPARRFPVLPKREVAQRILDWVVARREETPKRRHRVGKSPARAR